MAQWRGQMSKTAWTLTVARWAGLILLPPTGAALTGFAAVKTGPTRTLFVIGLIFTALLLAFLQVYGEVQKWAATKSAVQAKVALARALNQAGRPLVNLLGRVAEADEGAERMAAVNSLITRTVGMAHSQCGKLSGVKAEIRCVFYQFVSPDHLKRVYEEGRQGRAARLEFIKTNSDTDRWVVEFAHGEDCLLFPDVDESLSNKFAGDTDREYKCLLMVPVRTNVRSYGFLSVDADKPYALTHDDAGYVILMAGVLASAIALLGEEYPRLNGSDGGPSIPNQPARILLRKYR